MRNSIRALFLCLLVGCVAASPSRAAPDKWRGYLIDKQCADSVREDSDPLPFIEHHTKDCALMTTCRRKGYSIYVPGITSAKWFDLDKKGNEIAIKLLQASKRKRFFYVEATGTARAKTLMIKTIKEIEEAKAQ